VVKYKGTIIEIKFCSRWTGRLNIAKWLTRQNIMGQFYVATDYEILVGS